MNYYKTKEAREKVKKVVVKALDGKRIYDADRDFFDEWKWEHSSSDVIDLLKEVGRELRKSA